MSSVGHSLYCSHRDRIHVRDVEFPAARFTGGAYREPHVEESMAVFITGCVEIEGGDEAI